MTKEPPLKERLAAFEPLVHKRVVSQKDFQALFALATEAVARADDCEGQLGILRKGARHIFRKE